MMTNQSKNQLQFIIYKHGTLTIKAIQCEMKLFNVAKILHSLCEQLKLPTRRYNQGLIKVKDTTRPPLVGCVVQR